MLEGLACAHADRIFQFVSVCTPKFTGAGGVLAGPVDHGVDGDGPIWRGLTCSPDAVCMVRAMVMAAPRARPVHLAGQGDVLGH